MAQMKQDARYTVTREFCGHPQARHVARFCGEWVGATIRRTHAWKLARKHKTARDALFTPETFAAPSCWASYLINADGSGLTRRERAQADAWVESIGMGAPVGCEDAGFIHYHDARDVGALPSDCQTYTFLPVNRA